MIARKRKLISLLWEATNLLHHDGRHVADRQTGEFPWCQACDWERRVCEATTELPVRERLARGSRP